MIFVADSPIVFDGRSWGQGEDAWVCGRYCEAVVIGRVRQCRNSHTILAHYHHTSLQSQRKHKHGSFEGPKGYAPNAIQRLFHSVYFWIFKSVDGKWAKSREKVMHQQRFLDRTQKPPLQNMRLWKLGKYMLTNHKVSKYFRFEYDSSLAQSWVSTKSWHALWSRRPPELDSALAK